MTLVMPSFEASAKKGWRFSQWVARKVPGLRWIHLGGVATAFLMGPIWVSMIFGLGAAIIWRPLGYVGIAAGAALCLLVWVRSAQWFGLYWRMQKFDAESFVRLFAIPGGIAFVISFLNDGWPR